MSKKTVADLAKKMKKIDFAMLSTRTDNGAISGRPMSNNQQVDYDGDSFYFALDDARSVHDIKSDPNVGLAFQGEKYFFINVEGKAELIKDKQAFKEHWTPDLDRWFKDGIDTPGLVLIKVHADRIHYWDGEEDGEIVL